MEPQAHRVNAVRCPGILPANQARESCGNTPFTPAHLSRIKRHLILRVSTLGFGFSRFPSDGFSQLHSAIHSFRAVSYVPSAIFRRSEIVHIQGGQCGNQIGAKFWEVRIETPRSFGQPIHTIAPRLFPSTAFFSHRSNTSFFSGHLRRARYRPNRHVLWRL